MKPVIFTTEFFLSSLGELQGRGLEDENQAPHGSDLIERELERYYDLINEARKHLGALFDTAERRLLVEAAHGVIYELEGSIDHYPEDVMYCWEHDVWAQQHVDGNVMMTKLDTLNRVARFALVDAVERHWLTLGQCGCADLDKLFESGKVEP